MKRWESLAEEQHSIKLYPGKEGREVRARIPSCASDSHLHVDFSAEIIFFTALNDTRSKTKASWAPNRLKRSTALSSSASLADHVLSNSGLLLLLLLLLLSYKQIVVTDTIQFQQNAKHSSFKSLQFKQLILVAWDIVCECSQDTPGIVTLYSHRPTLTKELSGPWVICHSCYATADFSDETQSMLSPHCGGLNGEWGRQKQCRNTFKSFLLQLRRRWPRLDTAGLDVRLSECVRTGSIPGEALTNFSLHLRHAIRSLVVSHAIIVDYFVDVYACHALQQISS